MKTLYKVDYKYIIKEQLVTRVNDKSFWYLNSYGKEKRGNRGNRMSSYSNYFDTHQEAYDFVLNKLQSEIQRAKNSLEDVKDKLEKFLQLNLIV